jgi:hypothetical protein
MVEADGRLTGHAKKSLLNRYRSVEQAWLATVVTAAIPLSKLLTDTSTGDSTTSIGYSTLISTQVTSSLIGFSPANSWHASASATIISSDDR